MNKNLLTVRDASAYLGLSIRTMRRIIKKKQVPYYRINGSIRIPIDGVAKYLDSVLIDASCNTNNRED